MELLNLASILNIVTAAIGLGMVIFVHELGHFAVAKWCGVFVERFSIGFGPVLLCYKWGDTEYALSAIPFGGYVKMLGQDDIDPGQMTDDQVAANPRSYTSKTVPQRMAIISAGVIMNLITGWMFFSVAYGLGVEEVDAQVGNAIIGMPAWEYGIRSGDTLLYINGRKVREFTDIPRGVALSSGPLEIEFMRPGEKEHHKITITPDSTGDRRMMGISEIQALRIHAKSLQVAAPGSPAEKADFHAGDEITAVDGQPVSSWVEIEPLLHEKRAQTLELTLKRLKPDGGTEQVTTKVAPAPVMGLGLRLDLGKITAIRKDSPAAKAEIRVGDRLAKVGGLELGRELDPLGLPDYFYEHRGQPIEVLVQREIVGGEPQTLNLTVTSDGTLPGSEPSTVTAAPLSVPGLGLAFQFLPTVLSVDEGSSAAKAGIKPGAVLQAIHFSLKSGAAADNLGDEKRSITIDAKGGGFPYALYLLSVADNRDISVTLKDGNQELPLALNPMPGQFRATLRGMNTSRQSHVNQAESFGEACSIGFRKTIDSVTEVYLTIRTLVTGGMSIKNLHGPVGIANFAYIMAEQGPALFLLFLGAISMNLAVINFLPIPVLDGGHMVFLIYEGLTGKTPSERVIATATYIGLAMVLTLMATVIYLDLFVHRN